MEASRVRRQLRLLKSPDRSFEQLYRRHAREVYQYALALLANPADAEDVTQTTFMNAYRAFQRGERPHKPHNWLITIAHNVCRMRWRQAGSRPREVALDEAPEPAAFDTDRPDLDEVLASLATLTFNQRSALVMRELEGRTYQEISEVLGVSVSAVEALLFRARRRLQVDRKTLGVLTTVPLPGSLGSFFGGGGAGAVAAGGTLVGADLAVKGATVLAVGMAAAGVGLKGVEAVRAPKAPPAQASAVSAAVTKHTARANRRTPGHVKVRPRNRNLRNAVATTPRTERPRTPANASPPASSTPSATAGVAPPASPTVVKPPALPTVELPALPALPPPPPVALPPPPPVALPPVPPAPPVPPLPPVKLPPLPPPPPLPPLPPLNNP